VLNFLVSFLITVLSVGALGAQSANYGYTNDVAAEREEGNDSIFVIFDVEKPPETRMQDAVFTAQISKELVSRYEREFGRIRAEQSLLYVKPNSYYIDERGRVITAESINNRERVFGEYMFRRLAEYHLDKKLKDDPDTKRVYELKEKLRKTEVEVAKGYKVEAAYSIAANDITFKFKNPFADLKIQFDVEKMSDTDSWDVSAHYEYSKTVDIDTYFAPKNSVVKVVTRKKLDAATGFDVSISPNNLSGEVREVFGIAGISHTF
jgi:hypothetical protein